MVSACASGSTVLGVSCGLSATLWWVIKFDLLSTGLSSTTQGVAIAFTILAMISGSIGICCSALLEKCLCCLGRFSGATLIFIAMALQLIGVLVNWYVASCTSVLCTNSNLRLALFVDTILLLRLTTHV